MTKADLLNLAARVEAADGADRELDGEIFDALSIGLERDGDVYLVSRGDGGPFSEDWKAVSAYTASLDAAASLVPVHCSWARYHNGVIEVATPDSIIFKVTKAQSAALALTAAALRAMAEEAGE